MDKELLEQEKAYKHHRKHCGHCGFKLGNLNPAWNKAGLHFCSKACYDKGSGVEELRKLFDEAIVDPDFSIALSHDISELLGVKNDKT